MENDMKTKIKRLAQFMFDNAELIEKELKKSSHYRSLQFAIDMFKKDRPRVKLSLSLYDEKTTHYYLNDDEICVDRFISLCKQLNNESEVDFPPKQVEVREIL